MAAESEALRERIRKAIASQTQSNVNVLSSLHAVLDELGYVPDEAIEEVAESAGTTINTVWGVASFYTNFRFTPPGDHIVEICWGPTCHLLGATVILQGVLDDLGMSDEGETADNRLTLKYNTCLGACSQAPVISVDHRLMGRQTIESARSIVSQLKPGKGH
ncbi:MAG: NAD(P)H-dependent oxidoreductase subunit E [Chloroflexi bacterium]|nr:NAD(P)H-dependent oxidoreductase subunit E [Chloroflexota bacterium]MCH7654141.1 NAD(P)H-dependent oxidoreductase subunit E [Chloroflexota bacterium]